ncbi:MAG: hypothetical protein M3Q95_13650 [Bacteroidota bacterium]|nr:hypothetical protein [Bacteroidota bacterium]
MKPSKNAENLQSKKGVTSKKPRPEIRDNLDSRKQREAGYKGDISKKGDKNKKGED